jgi:SAM-dependent methyltransferase
LRGEVSLVDFFDRYDSFFETSRVGTRLADGTRSPRLSHRYKAIVERNRDLFQGARILDLASHDGRWSLAALDAGATRVVGVEGRHQYIAEANKTFAAYDVPTQRYSFIQGEVPAALAEFEPNSFDLILCLGLYYHTVRHYDFFDQFYRLAPRHVILDTAISPGPNAVVVFRFDNRGGEFGTLPTTAGLPTSISGMPSHEMITMLCDQFRFTWHLVDWRSFGITRWDGVEDYQNDRRRTYVLTRIDP